MNFGNIFLVNPRLQSYFSLFMISAFLILYTILSLTIAKIQIFPTINRITQSDVAVNWSLTGSQDIDIIITTIIFSATILVTFKKILSIPISIIIFLTLFIPMNFTSDLIPTFAMISFFSTLPIILGLFCIPKFFWKNKSKNQFFYSSLNNKFYNLGNFLFIFFLVFVIIEFFSLIRWIIFPIVSNEYLPDWTWKLNFLENNLFLAFGLLSPILILLSVLSFFIKPIMHRISTSFSNLDSVSLEKNYKNNEFTTQMQTKPISYIAKIKKIFTFNLMSERRILLLVCFVAILPSIFLSLYPYLIINDAESVVRIGDIPRYQKWMNEFTLLPEDAFSRFTGLFSQIDNGSRPLSLLTIHTLSVITNQDEITILKYLPTLLGPLLIFSTYYLTRSLYPENNSMALIVAILTAASHQLVIGSYAAYYANWMSLIVLCVSLAFLIKSMRGDFNFINVILFSIFLTLSLFFHSYTWSFFVVVIAFFLIWSALQRKKSKKNLRVIIILSIALVSVISIDLLRAQFGDVGNSFQNNLTNPSTAVGFDQFTNWWFNLSTTFNYYLGGFLTNSALLLLVFLWTITAKYQNTSDRLIYSMLFVSILPILFGDFVIQSRILYDVFLQIPAGIFIYKIYKNPNFTFRLPFLVVVILIQFNYAFRAMSNIIFIPPI